MRMEIDLRILKMKIVLGIPFCVNEEIPGIYNKQ